MSVLERILSREPLSRDESAAAMERWLHEETPDVEIAGCLVALLAKGTTGPELAGFASTLRQQAISLPSATEDLVDTCGTGGGPSTFNMSTAAAIVAAAAGAKVAKHGNRAVTSQCGSADVLEALGVVLHSDVERLDLMLQETGFAFLFAPHHHPGMKRVGPIRKALGVRTVFNQLGPLANPAGARRQMIGVYDRLLVQPMAEALRLLGSDHGIVLHAADGMDEVSPICGTFGIAWANGVELTFNFLPADFGTDGLGAGDLCAGSSTAENAEILRTAVTDVDSRRSQAIVPNVAVALWIAGLVSRPQEGAELARITIADGAAARKLDQIIEVSR